MDLSGSLPEEDTLRALESLIDRGIIYYNSEFGELELWVPGLYQYFEKQLKKKRLEAKKTRLQSQN